METLYKFYASFCTFTNLRVVLGGFAIQLVLGYFYLWTPISAYVTSYYREKDHSLSNELTNIIQPSLGLAKALAMPFGAFVSAKLGYRLTTMIFGFLLCLAFLHSSICTNFWWFYFDYSILGGIVNGCLVMLPIYQIQKYFTNYKGVATGIVFSGYGLGSIIWSQISFHLINPNNLQAQIDNETKKKFFPSEVSENVPAGLQLLGIIFFTCLVISSIIAFIEIQKEPEIQSKIKSDNNQDEEKPFVSNQILNTKSKEKTYTELLFSQSYLIIVIMAMLSSLFPMMIINYYKLLSLDLHNDDKFIANIVVTCSSIANGLARVTWGFIYDKIGFHYSFLTNLIFQLIIILLYPILAPMKIGFTIVVSLSFFCQGGTFVLFPLYILEYFGYYDGSKVYGFVHYAFALANLLQYSIVYRLKDKYGISFLLVIFFVANSVAFLIKLLFNSKKKNSQSLT